ncbi:MAG: DUF4465 domain-containing protein [Prolixibacteraceae bacterium]
MKRNLLFLFLLLCGLSTSAQGYQESFESDHCLENNSWTIINQGGSNAWAIAQKPRTGDNSVSIKYNRESHDDYLITPYLEVKEGDQFSFWAKASSTYYSEKFDVVITELAPTPENFTTTLESVEKVPAVYTAYTYDLKDYVGKKVYIAIHTTAKNQGTLSVDDFSCPNRYIPKEAPGKGVATNPTDQSTDLDNVVTLEWANIPFSESYLLSVGTNVEADNLHKGKEINGTSLKLTSLKYNTTYYWKVSAQNEYGIGASSEVFRFTTMEDPTVSSFPWTEDFEGATFPPQGWKILNPDNDSQQWIRSNTQGFEGSKCASITSGYGRKNEWLITAPIILPTKALLKYYAKEKYAKVKIGISTTGTAAEDFEIVHTQSVTESMEQYLLDLSKWQGKRVRIGFYMDGYKSIDLDHISIKTGENIFFASASYTSTADTPIKIGATNKLLTKSIINTEGEAGSVPLENITLAIPEATDISSIKKLKVWTSSEDTFEGAVLLKEVTPIESKELSVSVSHNLVRGANYFWITADINEAAKRGSLVGCKIASLVVGGKRHALEDNKDYVLRSLEHMLNMEGGEQIEKISSDLYFYDNGGIEERYTTDFEGTITFKPHTEGKVISLRFNSFDIFKTSSTGGNDLFEIYAGSTKDSQKLIGTYLEMPPVIESESNDGALTIHFKVNTGIPKTGWEAVVKEITPQKMEVSNVQAIDPSNKVFAPDDSKVLLGGIKVTTSHTITPLILQSIPFGLEGAKALEDVSNLYLVSTGINATFKPENIIGTTSIEELNGTIATKQALRSGDNYFWIAADIKENATNKDQFSLSIPNLKISEQTHSLNSKYEYTISTDYAMPSSGTYEVNVATPIRFTDSNPEGKYEPRDRATVTFVPKRSGEKVRIKFNSFHFPFSSSSYYGMRAEFKIYDGKTKASELFALNARNKDSGPDSFITSTSEDGALTIYFDSKANASYHTAEGWDAVVTTVKDEPLHVTEATQKDLSSNILNLGEKNRQMLLVKVAAEGTQLNPNAQNLEWNLDYGDTEISSIEQVHVYYLANKDNFEEAEKLGSFTGEERSHFNTSKALVEGDNHFWITLDLSSDAAIDSEVKVKLSSLTSDTKAVVIQNNDNYASGIFKKILLFNSEIEECSINNVPTQFYDDGAAEEVYSKSQNHSIVFVPETPGEYVRIDWNKIDLDKYGYDEIKVYNGRGTDKEKLLSTYEKTLDTPVTDKATNDDGVLTVHFKSSSYSTPKDGWEASIVSFTPKSIAYKEAELFASEKTNVLKGEEKYRVLRMDLTFDGEKSFETIKSFHGDFGQSTQANDIQEVQLWYSKESTSLENAVLIEGKEVKTNSKQYTFSPNMKVEKSETIHFWVTYNIKSSATIGDRIDGNITSIDLNDQNVSLPTKPEQTNTITAGKHGVYEVGPEKEYLSLQVALEDLAAHGIDGATTLNISDGRYDEVANFPYIQGLSSSNPLTIQSASHDATKVTYVNQTATEEIKSIFHISHNAHVTIKDISFESGHKSLDELVKIDGNSQHITFESCRFIAPLATSYREDIKLIKTEAENVANQNNDHLCFRNNHFEGGYIALDLGGTGYVRLPKQKDCIVEGNTFINQGSKSIYLHDTKDIHIFDNTIQNNLTTKGGYQGMDIYRASGSLDVYNNTVDLQLTDYAYGIECRDGKGIAEERQHVYNNSIAINTEKGRSFGIYISRECRFIDVVYNSVNMYGNNSNAVGIASIGRNGEYPLSHHFQYNNIMAMAGYAMYFKSLTAEDQVLIQKNNLFSRNGVKIDDTDIATIEEINAKDAFTDNIAIPSIFISNTDLHLTNDMLLDIGEAVTYVAKDMDNEVREYPTTVGADQYKEISKVAPLFTEGYPKVVSTNDTQIKVEVSSDKAGEVFCHLYTNEANKLSAEEIIAQAKSNSSIVKESISAGKAKIVVLNNLEPHTQYKISVVVEDLNGLHSILKTLEAETDFEQTKIADFEQVIDKDGVITSGTIDATGITIFDSKDDNHQHVAQIAAKGKGLFKMNNTVDGISCKGFYYQSSEEAQITIQKTEGNTQVTLPTTEGRWNYYSLLQYGSILSFEIKNSGSALNIDDIHKKPLALTTAPIENIRITKGENANVEIVIIGGHAPYNVTCLSKEHRVNQNHFTFEVAPRSSEQLFFTVTDYKGEKTTGSVIIEVTAPLGVVDFESYNLTKESFWGGNPLNDEKETRFYSKGIGMYSYHSSAYQYFMGWNYSNKTNNKEAGGIANQHTAITGKGANNSKNYGVVYVRNGKTDIVLSGAPQGDIISGMYVTNNTYAVTSMKNGDSYAKKFGGENGTDQDWFKLVAYGYDVNNQKTGETEIYLADYRSNNPSEDYILDDWKWMDLSSLGKVTRIEFKMFSSDKGAHGINTPTYFCMDNLNGSSPSDHSPKLVKDLPKIKIGKQSYQLDLSNYFVDPDGDQIQFEVQSSSTDYRFEINGNLLTIVKDQKTTEICSCNYTITARSKEKSTSVQGVIDISTRVNEVDNSLSIKVGPNPTSHYFKINTTSNIERIEIFDINGVLIVSSNVMDTQFVQDVTNWHKGLYIIRLRINNQNILRKIVVQ